MSLPLGAATERFPLYLRLVSDLVRPTTVQESKVVSPKT